MTRLDEFDKVEWRDVCRRINPALTDEEFERMWIDFQKAKADRQRRMGLQ